MGNTPTSADRLGGATEVGKAAAIEALSHRYRVPLQRFFEKRANQIDPADTEDLVQEVFLRLANSQQIETPEAYLFQTAANLLRDRHRRLTASAAAQHEEYDEALHGHVRETLSPERLLQGTQLISELVAALHELPERTRAIFAFYHFEDLPHSEIARRLGIAVSTVEKHMGRANSFLLKRVGYLP